VDDAFVIQHVIPALRSRTVVELLLTRNMISDPGAMAIAEALLSPDQYPNSNAHPVT